MSSAATFSIKTSRACASFHCPVEFCGGGEGENCVLSARERLERGCPRKTRLLPARVLVKKSSVGSMTGLNVRSTGKSQRGLWSVVGRWEEPKGPTGRGPCCCSEKNCNCMGHSRPERDPGK